MERADDVSESLKGRKDQKGSGSSRWRQSFMGPSPVQQEETTRAHVDSKPPKLQSKSSRMSLFSLFSKPNVERARGHREDGLTLSSLSESTPAATSPPSSASNTALRPAEPTALPSLPASHETPKLKPLKSSSSTRLRPNSQWHPPPLFQAYPQAIKYATLHTSIASAEALVKTQQEHRKQQNNIMESMASKGRLDSANAGSKDGKQERSKLTSKRMSAASPFHVAEFTTKIYMLLTSGYVLQYAGSGAFDRLPEKLLQLGPDSAAFASDMISGKHWVLHISQTAQEDGTIAAANKGLLAKFRLQNSIARRHASNFLLVLESAQEMDSWLNAVKKEIEALGGKQCKPEAESRSFDKDERTSDETEMKPSHRFSVQRDPSRFNQPRISTQSFPFPTSDLPSPTIVTSEWDDGNSHITLNGSETGSTRSSKPSSSRQSVETSTTISPGGVQLNQLREGSRLSIMSTATSVSDTLTEATSRASTPELSPLVENYLKIEPEPSRDPTSLKSFAMNPSLSNSRRRSVQTPLPTTDENIAADAGSPGETDQRTPTAVVFNRAPRYRQDDPSPEKRTSPSFQRSLSAPAPTIPLPPLPHGEENRERSISPQLRTKPLPSLSLAPRSVRTPTPQLSPALSDESPHIRAVNFSRRRSALPDLTVKRMSRSFERRGSYQSTNSSCPSIRETEDSVAHESRDTPPSPPSPPYVDCESPPGSPNFSLPIQSNSSSTSELKAAPLPTTIQNPTAQAQKQRHEPTRIDSLTSRSKDLQAIIIPRRRQSPGRPLPLPVAVKPNRPQSIQARPPQTPSYHQLRRPTSLQVRSNHAPFLSTRPVPQRSASGSSIPGPPPTTSIGSLLSGPNIRSKSGYFRDNVLTDPLRKGTGQGLVGRPSIALMQLPPPAPPPTMPLPLPPPTMPLPLPPPTIPLPPTPQQTAV